MWICVRSKDAQKQLARTSLKSYQPRTLYLEQLKAVVDLSHVCTNTKSCVRISVFNVAFHHPAQSAGNTVIVHGLSPGKSILCLVQFWSPHSGTQRLARALCFVIEGVTQNPFRGCLRVHGRRSSSHGRT